MGTSIREQLLDAYYRSLSFEGIVGDYTVCMHKIREIEIRNAQLDKEARELRLENDTLLKAIEDASKESASFAELEESKAQANALQLELLAAYKERTLAAEARSLALEQLEIVRDNYAKQTAELESSREEENMLKSELFRSKEHANTMEKAKDIAVKELRAREAEIHASHSRAAALEDENKDLVDRILKMKDEEAQRLNEMNRLREDILRDAKRQAAEILANCRAAMAKEVDARGAAGILDASMKNLNIAAEGVGATELPATVMRSHPDMHKGGCFSVAFDVTGSTCATCGADRTVKLWDVLSGTNTASLRGSHEGLNDVAFTCDSHLILGAEDRHAVRIWDVKTGRLLNVALTGHANKVTGVTASPTDLTEAVSCAADRTIKLWKVDKGICQRTFLFRSVARRVTICPDHGLVASAHFDGRLRFWDLRSRISDPVHEVELHGGRETYAVSAAMSGGAVATVGRDNALVVVDTRIFKVKLRLSGGSFEADVWSMPAWNPTGSHVASGSKDGALYIWETKSSASTSSAHSSGVEWPKRLRFSSSTPLSLSLSKREDQGPCAVVGCAWSPVGLPLVTGDKLGRVTFWK